MADGTKIEWTDATVNAVNGCSVVSPGCTNCYAMRLAGTRMKTHPTRAGLTIDTKAGPVWNGEIRVNEKAMLEPLRWRRPRNIFWNAHGDLFHPAVPDAVIDRCFAVMALTTQHVHQVLTKRGDRMREYITTPGRHPMILAEAVEIGNKAIRLNDGWPWPLPNVWLGVSVEDQKRADERIPDLLATPAAVRFLSCEPLIGPVDLRRVRDAARCVNGEFTLNALTGDAQRAGAAFVASIDLASLSRGAPRKAKIDWVICGGESGRRARPMHPDWARALRDQCAAAGVPFFFKQWGEWQADEPGLWSPDDPTRTAIAEAGKIQSFVRVGKKRAGRLLDGVTHDGMPG